MRLRSRLRARGRRRKSREQQIEKDKGRGKTHLEEVDVLGRERGAEQGHRRGRREEDGRRRRHHVQIARDRIDVRVRPRRRPPARTTLAG